MINILITGSDGYIANHLAVYLNEKFNGDVNIVGFDITQKKYKDSYPLKNILKDLRNMDEWPTTFDVVFHLAAVSNVSDANANPYSAMHHNIQSTTNLLDKVKFKNLIFASTGSVYGLLVSNYLKDPYSEDQPKFRFPVDNKQIYAYSKLLCENLLKLYALEYGKRIRSLRLSNVAGIFHDLGEVHVPETHIMPRLAKLNNFQIYGNSDAIRDYIHITDVCDAMYKMFLKMRHDDSLLYDVYNVSSGVGHSVDDVISEFQKYRDINITKSPHTRPGDMKQMILNNLKIRLTLGYNWKPENNFEKIVESYFKNTKYK